MLIKYGNQNMVGRCSICDAPLTEADTDGKCSICRAKEEKSKD